MSALSECNLYGAGDEEFLIRREPVDLDADYPEKRKEFDLLPFLEKVEIALRFHPKWQYRSAHAVAKDLEVSVESVQQAFDELVKKQLVVRSPSSGLYGHVLRVDMEYHKEEKSLREALLWEKSRPLDPNTFIPIDDLSSGESLIGTDMCESAQEGIDMSGTRKARRERHHQHMKDLVMYTGYLPENLIVKAIVDAMMHAREVSEREHIKADRIERVNQFIVSLRRQLSYMDDKYRTEREHVSANLTTKELWYDIGVLNPERIAGLRGSIQYNTVQRWVLQAQAGIGSSSGSLQDAIDKALTGLKGTILVAQGCNLVTDQLNKDADKVVSEMAALAADL